MSKKAKQTKSTKKKDTSLKSKGTGLHLDCNPYSLWQTQSKDGKYTDLEWWRPFQSFVVVTDGCDHKDVKDGGLEIVPGFYSVCERYFQEHPGGTTHGRNLFRWGSYNTKFSKKHDDWIYKNVKRAQRMPEDWEDDPSLYSTESAECASLKEYKKYVTEVTAVHDKLTFLPVKKGDFVFWDMRTPHQNSDANNSDYIRSVFYHAYMVAQPATVNLKRITEYAKSRKNREHIADFPKTWRDIEKTVSVKPLDTQLSKLLFNEEKWDDMSDEAIEDIRKDYSHLLTERHISFFKRFGYVVVENVFNEEMAQSVFDEAVEFGRKKGCDLLSNSVISPAAWSNIAGSFGSMLELFYQSSMEKIRYDPAGYAVTSKLCEQTWGTNTSCFSHPYSDFDGRKLWVYIDRMNFRHPANWPKTAHLYNGAAKESTSTLPLVKKRKLDKDSVPKTPQPKVRKISVPSDFDF